MEGVSYVSLSGVPHPQQHVAYLATVPDNRRMYGIEWPYKETWSALTSLVWTVRYSPYEHAGVLYRQNQNVVSLTGGHAYLLNYTTLTVFVWALSWFAVTLLLPPHNRVQCGMKTPYPLYKQVCANDISTIFGSSSVAYTPIEVCVPIYMQLYQHMRTQNTRIHLRKGKECRKDDW